MQPMHALVLGLGESGLAMAQWLDREGAKLRVADSRATPPGVDELRRCASNVELVCGAFTEALLEDIDVLALSPGLSINEPVVLAARARGIGITGEIELFARALDTRGLRSQCKVIAITGTNGKTTTTTLVGDLCRAAGWDTAVAGNISPAALTELMSRLDAKRMPEVWVLELSSFQLETTASLRADAATVLNVSDDHLDRHKDMGGYAAAKQGIFNGDGIQVLNRQDKYVMSMALEGRGQVSFGLDAPTGGDAYGLIDDAGESWLVRGRERLLLRDELPLAGSHNVANALAAIALCEAIGISREPMVAALKKFNGLPHRVAWVARRADGVDFYDDSKGTNVGATVAALQGLGRKVVLIAGGDGKGQDFWPLRDVFKLHARAVVLIGRDAQRLAAEVEGCGVTMIHAADLDGAVIEANARALPGDAVLLSPACASFDMFRNYAHRAQVFVDAVKRLPEVASV
ncbi:MAG TPA: UDP-N-acetylmuramoyl-L-alanine--D-glutamate ligase [Rhodocyclaceae bacterium]|nr:UDP-N-acetylmuramoyl-L-alanine--D-glutamate ligase [Rhodocyclaceae bacterium]